LRGVARSSTSFAEELLTLAELQTELVMLESREWAQRQAYPSAMAGGALAIALGLIPVAFLTLAAVLYELAGLSIWASLLVSLILGTGMAAALGAAAFYGAKGAAPFERSRREWDSNVRWFRNMVRRQGRRW